MDEDEGVETVRSRCGMASSASEGETLGEGELDLRAGEVTLLVGGLAWVSVSAIVSAMVAFCSSAAGFTASSSITCNFLAMRYTLNIVFFKRCCTGNV